MSCAACKRDCSNAHRYQLSRFDPQNRVLLDVTLCSIPCLLRWGYENAAQQGARLAVGVQQRVRQLLDLFK